MKKCPMCVNSNIMSIVKKEEFGYKGQSLIINDYKLFQCENCGEEFIDEAFEKSIEKRLRDFQKSVDGLLSSHEIQVIRTSLGFTQDYFGELLGGGKKAFARYENGTVTQSKPMDNLLRILRDRPESLDSIAKVSSADGGICGTEGVLYNPNAKLVEYKFKVA